MNKNANRCPLLICLVLVLFMPASLGAHDFGLLFNQSAAFEGAGGSNDNDYEAALIPRFSAQLGDYGDLFLSASFAVSYEYEEWNLIPELLRNEISWRFGDIDFRAGRMIFTDPMGIVADGLFDGVRVSRHTVGGTFGFGLWYTGLLYKNRANISMTDDDAVSIIEEVDWSDFWGTYFASRRLVAALYWQHPSVAELFRLNVALIGQGDLNERHRSYNSQYLVANASLPLRSFIFELGGAFEIAQVVADHNVDVYTAIAVDAGLRWLPPTSFHSMLSLTGRITSWKAEEGSLSAFTPITAVSHGDVLQARISGLSMISLNYTARLHPSASLGLTVSHFVLMDGVSYTAYPLNGHSSRESLLGTEFFGRVIWSPFSDVSLNLGGGAFLPRLGNVVPDADPRWRVEMAATLALR